MSFQKKVTTELILRLFYVLQKVKVELMNLEKQLATAKKQLEDETIARVDLENRVQSLKEELAFKNQLHAQVRGNQWREGGGGVTWSRRSGK